MSAPLHEARVPTRWGDLDVLRHVNNAVYFTYAEQARTEWLASVAGAWSEAEGPVLAETRCAFRRPVHHPATVLVRLFVERVGQRSLTLRHELRDAADEGTLYAEGESTLVWVAFDTGRPVPLPDAVREAAGAPPGMDAA